MRNWMGNLASRPRDRGHSVLEAATPDFARLRRGKPLDMTKSSICFAVAIVVLSALCAFFDLVSMASLVVTSLALWVTAVITTFVGLLWFSNRLGFKRWKASPRPIIFMLKVIAVGLVAMTVSGFVAPTGLAEKDNDPQAELAAMYIADQRDRWSGRFMYMPWRDHRRLERAREMIEQEENLHVDARFHLAMLLQHGNVPSDFESAYNLAISAAESGHTDAEWLAKAAFDRWQLSIGKPQKYDTQSKVTIGLGGVQRD
jgi:hypothetical protein